MSFFYTLRKYLIELKKKNLGEMDSLSGIGSQLESQIKKFKKYTNQTKNRLKYYYIYIVNNFNIIIKKKNILYLKLQIKLDNVIINYLKRLIKNSDANKKKNENL
jgi:CRISPR/Cas system-associated exonuclease Cas4 (RecB family)